MKLKHGDMLIMDVENGTLKLQVIGRNDVPRVEREGRGWSDGATALLNGADMAEFLDVISGLSGNGCEIGASGLSVGFEYDDTLNLTVLVLTVEGVSVWLTWPERGLLLYAVRSLAWRMFK